MPNNALSSSFCVCVLSLAGCAVSSREIPPVVSPQATHGTVHGGQQPVAGATITVWEMGTSGYGTGATQLASVISDQDGNFGFAAGAYTCDYANAPVYITAQGGNPGNSGSQVNPSLMLAAAIGTCGAAPGESISINEVTTVATAYALGQFFTPTLGGSPGSDLFGAPAAGGGVYNQGLLAADNFTVPVLVNLASGFANPGSATVTIETAKLYSAANILAACVNSTGASGPGDSTSLCGQLFTLTTPPGSSTPPADTLQAAVALSLYPYQNVAALYDLVPPQAPFVGLTAQPNDWTLAIAYTNPAMGLGINLTGGLPTSSSIDIDAAGRVWFPTNLSGATGVSFFDPASATFNGPYAAGLTEPQYVAIDLTGTVWATDQASPAISSTSTTQPGSTDASYTAINGVNGGPIAVDRTTVLFASLTTDGLYSTGAISGGNVAIDNQDAFVGMPTGFAVYPFMSGSPTHVVLASTGSPSQGCAQEFSYTGSNGGVLAATGGTCGSGGAALMGGANDIAFSAASLNQIGSENAADYFTPPVAVSGPQGMAVDGAGNLWIANSGSSSVSTMAYHDTTTTNSDYQQTSPVAYLHDANNGNTMPAPYGLAIDGSGNVWVSNAGCIALSATACVPGPYMLTELVGAAAPTVTPLAAQLQTGPGARPALRGTTSSRSLSLPKVRR